MFVSKGSVAYRQIDGPDPGPADAVVRLVHSWISNGTESSYLRGERVGDDTPWHPGNPYTFPIVAAYQKIGVVEWVGSEIDDLIIRTQ